MICRRGTENKFIDTYPTSNSQGCSIFGIRRSETAKPQRPALLLLPRPTAPSSRISPPDYAYLEFSTACTRQENCVNEIDVGSRSRFLLPDYVLRLKTQYKIGTEKFEICVPQCLHPHMEQPTWGDYGFLTII